jgi:hypothetical protein
MNDLITRSALEWLSENTTIPVDLNDPDATISLPARAQLFVQKYAQLMNRSPGVISQSIEGLSQSFDASGDVNTNIWALARALLMGDLKSQVKVTPAKRRW